MQARSGVIVGAFATAMFMRRFVLALISTIATVAIGQIALAAPPPPPAVSWTGAYIGGNLGGVWGDYVDTMYRRGYTKGCYTDDQNEKFCPGHPLNRGEMAVFIIRAKMNHVFPSGVSLQVSTGAAGLTNNYITTLLGSAGGFDSTLPNFSQPSTTSSFFGINGAVTTPVLLGAQYRQDYLRQLDQERLTNLLRPGPLGIALGAEAGIDFFGSSTTNIQGLPGSTFLAAANDSLSIKANNMTHVAGVVHVPIFIDPRMPIIDFFGKGGVAWVDTTTSYTCPGNGFCGVAPATSPFSASQNVTLTGPYWGVGFGTALPFRTALPPPILTFEFDQASTGSKPVNFGLLATRLVQGTVAAQEINVFRVAITQPLIVTPISPVVRPVFDFH